MNIVGECDFDSGKYSLYLMSDLNNTTIYGKVDLDITVNNLFVRGVWVKLKGVKVFFDSRTEIDFLKDDEDIDLLYHIDGYHIVFTGLGEDEVDADASVMIPLLCNNHYSWPFSFNLPRDYPLSFCDNHFQSIYTLSVVLDSPTIPIAISTVSYVVVIDKLTSSMSKKLIENRN